jgi:Peptidase family M28
VIDFRIYRAAFLPVVVVLIAVAFSLEGAPGPVEPELSPAGFEPQRAFRAAREVAELAPSRPPGSEGDAAAADLVEERFAEVDGGTVSEQVFDSSYEGEDVSLRNVILTLPGETERTVMVIAGRDSPRGPGAAASAAATGVLIELANVLGNFDHSKTVVLASTDGVADGASGARELAEGLAEPELIDGVVVLSQPGAAAPAQPYVVTSSVGDSSTSIQLVRTVERAVEESVGTRPQRDGTLTSLARLAVPTGLGEQAVLIDAGLDSVAISSAGERPLPAEEDDLNDLDAETLADFGGAALSAVLALDAAAAPLEHGPDAYVTTGDALLPGGVLGLLALALLLPPALAAVDGLARAARRRFEPGPALRWAGSLALPLLAALLALYLLGLLGLVPRPRFPFDPGLFGIGVGEILAMLLLAVIAIAGYARLDLLKPPRSADPDTLPPALGLLLCLGVLLVWLVNPLLALLLTPLAHAWLLAARHPPPPRWLIVAVVVLALLPPVLAALDSLGAIGAGLWDLVLMVAGGQIGALLAIALCLVGGCLVGLVASAGRGSADAPGSPQPRW